MLFLSISCIISNGIRVWPSCLAGVAARSTAYSHLVPRSGCRAQRWIEQKSIFPDVAQFGRALALGARCRRFKSCRPDQKRQFSLRKLAFLTFIETYFIPRFTKLSSLILQPSRIRKYTRSVYSFLPAHALGQIPRGKNDYFGSI